MDQHLHARARRVFLEAAARSGDQRRALVAARCDGDPALRREVESLLAHHETAAGEAAAHGAGTLERAPETDAGEAGAALGRVRRRLLAATLVAAVVVAAIGAGAYLRVEASLAASVASRLVALRDAHVHALRQWLARQEEVCGLLAERPAVVEAVGALLAADPAAPESGARRSDALARLEAALEVRAGETRPGHCGFAVVTRERGLEAGVLVERDGGELRVLEPGRCALTPEGHREFARALEAGRPTILMPYARGTLARHAGPDAPRESAEPLMLVFAPLRDVPGEGGLAFLIDPHAEFAQVLLASRTEQTGESYVFDDEGVLLTDSRFVDQLEAAGLVPADGAGAELRVHLRDPGVDVRRRRPVSLPLERPFTLAAAAAIERRAPGVDVSGYRDYRGVQVMGAWTWLRDYDVGVVTEVDVDEAFVPGRVVLGAFALQLGLLVATAGALVGAVWVAARHRERAEHARRLGRYTLVEPLGRGGLGEVWRARHAMLRRPTAVKLLRADAVSPAALARFEREVQLTSQLDHPNTIEVYDYGRADDGTFYYAMELFAGATLDDVLDVGGPLPPARVVHLLRQLAGSLAEAHARGLVHRDVKPANLLVGPRHGRHDVVKVLDFGLVADLGAPVDGRVTQEHDLSGTPLYMAPERLRDPLHVDPRADVYSLGAVAFRLLTGRNLFAGESALQVWAQVLEADRPRASACVDGVPPALDRLVARCVARDPAERPADGAAVAELLDTIDGVAPWTAADAAAWWRRFGPVLGVDPDGPPIDRGAVA